MPRPRNEVCKDDSKDLPDWRQFSGKTERTAHCLKAIAHFGKATTAKDARRRISLLLGLRDAILPVVKAYGEICAAVGSPGDVVRIDSRQYASAHHAALGEAELFLRRFVTSLEWSEDAYDQSKIIGNLANTRDAIANNLSEAWQADFESVPIRIQRERAAALYQQSRPPTATNGPKKIKPKPETLSVIRKIERGDDYDNISKATGKTVGSIRKINSQFRNALYEL